MTPRLRVPEVAALLACTPRAVQAMAARGDLPGAAQIGKLWTFDREKLERFIRAREAEVWGRKISTGARGSGGCAPPSGARKSEKAYELVMSKLLGN